MSEVSLSPRALAGSGYRQPGSLERHTPVRVTPPSHDALRDRKGTGEHERLSTAHRSAPRWSGDREDWLDALELVLGSRAEAELAYEVGTEPLRFEEEVLRNIAALPEAALDD